MSTLRIFTSAAFALLLVVGADRVVATEQRSPAFARAYKVGRADAARDIKKGILATEEWGLPADISVLLEYRRILRQRYAITVRRVAGCEVDDTILGHGNGYNDVSEAEIAHRYGPNLLDRVYAQAEKQHARSTQ